MRRARVLVAGAGTMLVIGAMSAACGDLKVADDSTPDAANGDGEGGGTGGGDSGGSTTSNPDSGSTDARNADASDAGFAEGKGPGLHGSLPSGYCCTADSECRYRHCVDTGAGGHMCLDECGQDAFCTRPDITFTCDTVASRCQPSAGFKCLSAATFTRGTKTLGACCNATVGGMNDGTTGSDCEGNQCASVGSAPLVCTNRCSFASDCSGGDAGIAFACIQFGTSKACVPTNSAYTCQ